MSQRVKGLLAPLLLLSLVLAACGPAGVATPLPAAPPASPPPTDTPLPAPTSEPAMPTDTPVSEDTEAPATAEEAPPDPLASDPEHPGFTLDGSPTLGDADAPIIIVDFSDFQ